MKEKTGKVFSIARDNLPVKGCTISKEVYSNDEEYICYFSLAEDTDISAEIYGYHKLLLVANGELEVYAPARQKAWRLYENDCIVTPTDTPVGMRSSKGAI